MASYILEPITTDENFDEEAYLRANPDVVDAIKKGTLESGRIHYDVFGKNEKRKMYSSSIISGAKRRKLERIKPLLRSDMQYIETPTFYDFLTKEMRSEYSIVNIDNVSGWGYDAYGMELIKKNEGGLVLDCGAGKRPVYFDNVVNFEIADYDTTDVRGVGEVLPFIDEAFDAVLSIAVLEHVKNPFLCARQISRVLKPGGSLMCVVPFLQPFHAYPHHYYNMTTQGLENLFADYLSIDKTIVDESLLPIWTLTWILRSWAEGLQGKTREETFSEILKHKQQISRYLF